MAPYALYIRRTSPDVTDWLPMVGYWESDSQRTMVGLYYLKDSAEAALRRITIPSNVEVEVREWDGVA